MSDEPKDSTTKAAEWIAEALADLVQATTEPVAILGLAELTRALERCAAALEAMAKTSAATLALIEKGQNGEAKDG